MNIEETIKEAIEKNAVVLYMKGTPIFPQCGFSGKVVSILKECDVDFAAINVLDDPDIREGIKTFSQWPTIPQLYIEGEFVGGCDIITQLFESGELQKKFEALA